MNSIIVSNSHTLSTDVQSSKNPALVYLASRSSANTRRNMRKCLNMVTDVLSNNRFVAPEKPYKRDFEAEADYQHAINQYKVERADYEHRYLSVRWQDIENAHLNVVKGTLLEATKPTGQYNLDGTPQTESKYKFTTVNLVLSAMRGVVNQTWELGLIDAETRDRRTHVKNIKGKTLPAGREIQKIEFLDLLEDCINDENSVGGVRDYAILDLMFTGGLRRNEVVNLKLKHIDFAARRVLVFGGKGNKDRKVMISPSVCKSIQAWIEVRNGSPSDSLFVTINRGGTITDRKMTTQALYQMIKRRADRQGIKNITPHDFRRTMITKALRAGNDLNSVSQRAGHSNSSTTARYDMRGEEAQVKLALSIEDFTRPTFPSVS